MPTYTYACTACSHGFETVQAITDSSLTTCPECGGALRKVFHPVGVAFKGSGFYRTDSRAKPEGGSGDSGSADGTSGSKESSDKGSSDGATGGTKEGGGEAKKPASSSDKPASKPAKTSSSSGTSATTS